jgi:hypothetical protein
MDFDFLILIFDLEFLKGVQSFKALTAKILLITSAWEVGRSASINVSQSLIRIVKMRELQLVLLKDVISSEL